MAVKIITSEMPVSRQDCERLVPTLTGVLIFFGEQFLEFITGFTVRNFDIILRVTVVHHQGEETIIGNIQL